MSQTALPPTRAVHFTQPWFCVRSTAVQSAHLINCRVICNAICLSYRDTFSDKSLVRCVAMAGAAQQRKEVQSTAKSAPRRALADVTNEVPEGVAHVDKLEKPAAQVPHTQRCPGSAATPECPSYMMVVSSTVV